MRSACDPDANQTISDPPTKAEVQALNDAIAAAVPLLNEISSSVGELGR